MPPLMMAGYEVQHRPSRAAREAVRGTAHPLSLRVSTGQIRSWDLFSLVATGAPDLAEWADKTLTSLASSAAERFAEPLTEGCIECEDIGFYGLVSSADPDMLTGLLRREGTGGYQQLTASGWRDWTPLHDQQLEILGQDLATDLAEAITAGACGLVRRYFWPKAFLPPEPILAAAPAPELADDGRKPPRVSAPQDEGWTAYAVVDDLDPGAVLEVIRLRRGPVGPELVAYRNGVWSEAPELLTDLQGVQPPPLVQLDQTQLDSVLQQIDGGSEAEGEGSADTGDPGEGLDEADKTPVAAAGLPKTQKCAYGDEPATKRILHSEGMAYIPVCAKHLAKGRTDAEHCTPDGSADPSNVVRVDPIAAAGPPAQERAKAAEKGQALPEGGFPIRNRDELAKAVKALGRATNPTAAKRHIIKRARALNAINALPEAWGVTAAAALVADAPLTVSPDPRAEQLRRYWTTGKGAAKIRWGTPGDWTRCYRQLRKYMGLRAKGYCQNLHKRSTGVWTGSRANPGRTAAALAAAGMVPAALSMEAALVAAVSTGRWTAPEGVTGMLKDGVYTDGGGNVALLRTLTAGGFPVAPPDEWLQDPQLTAPTPLTVDDDGRVFGHIATFDVAHIGLPGQVRAPRSRSDYAYFKTGELRTASGKRINVGQLTLAGGHAPLQADAAAAVAHYDNTASAVADVNVGDDRFGIWVAGGLRPEVTEAQLRTLRASAPSGDWRPINGHLELVACCQVNVPGFPTVRARVASGAITSLVAAGAPPLYARRLSLLSDAATAERVAALEAVVFDALTERPITADGETADAPVPGDSVTEGTPNGEAPAEGGKQVSEAVKRARGLAAQRRAQREAQPAERVDAEAAAEQTVQASEQHQELAVDEAAKNREARMAQLRMRVHGGRQPVAAASS